MARSCHRAAQDAGVGDETGDAHEDACLWSSIGDLERGHAGGSEMEKGHREGALSVALQTHIHSDGEVAGTCQRDRALAADAGQGGGQMDGEDVG